MQSLGMILKSVVEQKKSGIGSEQYLPDNAVCPRCKKLTKDHPALLPFLEARGLANHLPDRDFCHCLSPKDAAREFQAHRLAVANIPHREHGQTPRTFENFKGGEDVDLAFRSSREFADGKGPPVLVLTGGTGCGKSHLLEAIGRSVMQRGGFARYEFVPDLLNRFKATYDKTSELSESEITAIYEGMPVLLLDDLGAEKATEWAMEKLTALVDHRYREGKRLAIATNKEHQDFVAQGNKRLASRLFDITTGVVRIVEILAPDYRRATPESPPKTGPWTH